ncbi:MAG: hypothetical protein AAGA22_09090 [Pseudomonadota bacterium]
MFRKTLPLAALIACTSALSVFAAGTLDRIEDRRDLRESVVDEMYDRGPLDVIEDHFDRAEGRRDRSDNRHVSGDRIEDRRDLRESIVDEAYDRGPLDVVEDHIDRAEGVRDRLN